MSDLLRATRPFKQFRSALAGEGAGVVLVETSPRMRLLQAAALLGDSVGLREVEVGGKSGDGGIGGCGGAAAADAAGPPLATRLLGHEGVPLTWFAAVDSVTSQHMSSSSPLSSSSSLSSLSPPPPPPPPPPTLFIANEFFDALPVHQLVHNGKGDETASAVVAAATTSLYYYSHPVFSNQRPPPPPLPFPSSSSQRGTSTWWFERPHLALHITAGFRSLITLNIRLSLGPTSLSRRLFTAASRS
jgi:hypothetical protein